MSNAEDIANQRTFITHVSAPNAQYDCLVWVGAHKPQHVRPGERVNRATGPSHCFSVKSGQTVGEPLIGDCLALQAKFDKSSDVPPAGGVKRREEIGFVTLKVDQDCTTVQPWLSNSSISMQAECFHTLYSRRRVAIRELHMEPQRLFEARHERVHSNDRFEQIGWNSATNAMNANH